MKEKSGKYKLGMLALTTTKQELPIKAAAENNTKQTNTNIRIYARVMRPEHC